MTQPLDQANDMGIICFSLVTWIFTEYFIFEYLQDNLSSKGQLPNDQVTITFFAPAVQFFIAMWYNTFYRIYLARFWWWGGEQG